MVPRVKMASVPAWIWRSSSWVSTSKLTLPSPWYGVTMATMEPVMFSNFMIFPSARFHNGHNKMPVEARLCRQSSVCSHSGVMGRAQSSPAIRPSSKGGQNKGPMEHYAVWRRIMRRPAGRPGLEQIRSPSAPGRRGVPCKRIALPREVPRTVPGVFPTGPPSARARTGSSADLPPPRSQPAGSRDLIVSAPLSHFSL